MKRTLMGLLIVALLVGAASADPFIGNTLRYSIDVKDGCDITALGDTDVDLGTGDLTTTGAASVGSVTETGGTTGTDATYSGAVVGDSLESVNDTTVGGNLAVTGTSEFTDAVTFLAPPVISVAGIAPLSVVSEYWIEHLNADLLDNQTGAYYGTAANQTSQQTEIDACEVNATTQQGEIDACEVNATTQQGEIDACEVNATTQQGEIDAVEAAYLSKMVINVPISASSVDQFVFISDGGWTITSVKEVHVVAGNDGSAVNFTVMICDDTEAPDEGLMVHNATCDLKATAKTIQEPTLSGLAANVTVANNDAIAIDFQGTLTTLAGGVITIEMER